MTSQAEQIAAGLTAARKIYADYGERQAREKGFEPDKEWILKVLAGEADDTHGVKIALPPPTIRPRHRMWGTYGGRGVGW